MSAWIPIPWDHIARLLLQAVALFVVATLVFDAIHYTLHRCLNSKWSWLRRLASPHQAHHDFCDRQLVYHDQQVIPNLVLHVIPEYATQIGVCSAAFLVLDPLPVALMMGIFTVIFVGVMAMRGQDRNHLPCPNVPVAREGLFVGAAYHALHHVYPDSDMSSYTTLFDILMGTACQIRGRRIALTGSSGSFGLAMKELLERAGAVVVPLRFGVDYTYDDYSGADSSLATADILVLAHGAKGERAMLANCDSFLALIDRFRRLTRHRQVPVEVWAVGSEIECHPAFGNGELQSYARSKRAYARAAAQLMHDEDLLYRHIVPSAFRSRMGGGLMSGRTAARMALWLIRRGCRYVPVTYTGIAFVNFVPFLLSGGRGRSESLFRRPTRRVATRSV
jgi:monoglucosyldiacylglycerol epimerase